VSFSDPFLLIDQLSNYRIKHISPEGKGIDSPLETLEVLIVDCQTTGSRPERANLIEVGWIRTSAARAAAPDRLPVVSCLVQLPTTETIPSRVARLTGITQTDVIGGQSTEKVWRRLSTTARFISGVNPSQRCPTVIHFARFEKPFLRHLHKAQGAASIFPFDIICSHEIARRLLPELPRKGLRALAGYFGHTVTPSRRCATHAKATAVIWRQLVVLLGESHDIRTLSELKGWLERTPVPAATVRQYPMPEDIRRDLPDSPGVYRFVRSNGDLLYVGKATSLRQRVNSHFRKTGRSSEKSLEMLSQAAGLKITPTASALEAALLESEEIKRLRPPYNIALQADNRRTWFMSPHFSHFSPTPDRRHRLGPVLQRGPFAALHAIGQYITIAPGARPAPVAADAAVLLDLPECYCPDKACLREGIRFFRDRHAAAIDSKPLWRSLLAIGDRKRRLAAAAVGSTQEPTHGSIGETETGSLDAQWTAEDVVSRIESLLGQCARTLRRARWLILLSESSLVWTSRQRTITGFVISGGQVVDRFEVDNCDAPPLTPHYHRRALTRQRCLDLTTYDRLRVLMTEIRRLTASGRTVCLRTGKKHLLRETCLSEALHWV
jgi:DNA polymerase-3 subunit epsilon